MLMHTPKKQDIIKLYVHFRATGKANHLYRKSWIFMQTKTVPIPISESYTLLEDTERGSTIYKAYRNQEQQLVVLRKLRQTDQAIFRGTREAEFFHPWKWYTPAMEGIFRLLSWHLRQPAGFRRSRGLPCGRQ